MSQDEQATGDVPVESPVENSGWHAAMLRLLGSTRLVVLFAVLGLFLTAATLLIYGTLLAIKTIWNISLSCSFGSPTPSCWGAS